MEVTDVPPADRGSEDVGNWASEVVEGSREEEPSVTTDGATERNLKVSKTLYINFYVSRQYNNGHYHV